VVDHFDPSANNFLSIEAFTGPDGTGESLGVFQSLPFNFQRNFEYFMGITSSRQSIGSIVYRDLSSATGCTLGIDDIVFARR